MFFLLRDGVSKTIDSYVSGLEDELGINLDYKDITPYVFPFIQINDVHITGQKAEFNIYIDKISIYYNFFGIFKNPIKSIKINSFYIDYISDKVSDSSDVDEYINLIRKNISRVSQVLSFNFDIKRLRFRYVFEKTEFFINKASLKYYNDNKKFFFDGALLVISEQLRDYLLDNSLKMHFRLTGDIADTISVTSLINVENSYFSLKEQKFFVRLTENNFELQSLESLLPFEAFFSFSFDTKDISFHLETDSFNPSAIISVKQYHNMLLDHIWDSIYTVSVNLTYNLDNKKYIYDSSGVIYPGYDALRYISYSFDGDKYDLNLRYLDISTTFMDSKIKGIFNFRSEAFTGSFYAVSGKKSPVSFNIDSNVFVSPFKSVFIIDSPKISQSELAKISIRFFADKKWGYTEGTKIYVNAESAKDGFIALEGQWQHDSAFKFIIIADNFPVYIIYDSFYKFVSLDYITLIEPYLGKLLISCAIEGSVSEKYEIESIDKVRIYDNQNRLSFYFDYSTDEINIKKLSGNIANIPIYANFSLHYMKDFNGNISLSENVLNFYGRITEDIIEIHGDNFRLSFSLADTATFNMALNQFPVLFTDKNIPVLFDLEMTGAFYDTGNWKIYVNNFTVENLFLFSGISSRVSSSFIIFPTRIDVLSLKYNDFVSSLNGSASIVYTDFFSLFSLENFYSVFSFYDTAKNERYEGALSFSNGFIDGRLLVSNTPVSRFFPNNASGNMDIFLTVSGPRYNPDFLLEVKSKNVYADGSPVNIDFSLLSEDKKTVVNIAGLSYQNFSVNNLIINWDLASGVISSKGQAALKLGDKNYDSNISFIGATDKSVGSFWDFVRSPDIAFKLTLSLDNIYLVTEQNIWRFVVSYDKGHVSIKGAPGDSFYLDYDTDGNMNVTLLSPLPIRGKIAGIINKDEINLNTEITYLDLSSVSPILNWGEFAITSGIASGNIVFKGNGSLINADGYLNVENPECSLTLIPDALHANRLTLFFNENTIEIPETYVFAGESPALLNALIYVNYFSDISYKVDVSTITPQAIHIKYNFGILNVDGYVTGGIEISSTSENINIDGDLRVENARITISQNNLVDNGKNNFGTSVNLRFTSGPNVSFLWPSDSLPVLKLYADANQKLVYSLNSEEERYNLTGDISLRGGEVFYLEKSFYIREGMIRFNENEDSFDPTISVRAELRDFYEGEPLKIFLIARESHLSTFSPVFESQPSLSQDKLAIILGKSLYDISSNNQSAASIIGLSTDVLTQFAIVKGFEESVKDSFGLDIFSIRTHLFQSLLTSTLEDGQASEQNVTYGSGEYSIGRYLDNTTIIMGKYIGQNAFGELAFNITKANDGNNTALSFGGVDTTAEFLLELDTPFFLLSWKLKPENWDTLFVTDQSISINWGFSY